MELILANDLNEFLLDQLENIKDSYHFNPLWISYCKEYDPGLRDLSFQIVEKNKCLAFIPLSFGNNTVASFDKPLSVFYHKELNGDQKRLVDKRIVERVQEIRIENQNCQTLLSNLPIFLNWVWEENIEVKNYFEFYIDLRNEFKLIEQSIRKSFRSLINWGKNNLNTIIVNREKFDEALLRDFHTFHINVAGRETRSKKSWDIQFEMIKQGSAFAIMSYLEEELVAASLILLGSKEAFYGVGAYNRDLMAQNKPLSHWNLYTAISKCKEIGLEYIILGSANINEIDSKTRGISKFKKGFTDTVRLKSSVLVDKIL